MNSEVPPVYAQYKVVEIESGSLAKALKTLSIKFEVAIFGVNRLLGDTLAPSVSGEMTLVQALDRVLAGSAFYYELHSSGIVVSLRSADAKKTQDQSAGDQSFLDLEHIEISSYSDSASLSVQARMNSVESKEFIFSDEIGKLPEQNVAEVIQRASGITITRDIGEGRRVSIRGGDPGLTAIMINGQDAIATSASIDARGSVNNTRSFDLNLIPSELFSEIEVYKSANALVGGGVSGVVNLKTRRPLELSESKRSLSIKKIHHENGGEGGEGGSFFWGNFSENREFGAIFGGSYPHYSPQETGFSTIRWEHGSWGDLSAEGRVADAVAPELVTQLQNGELFHPRYNRYDLYQRDIERHVIYSSLQWQPTDNLEFTLDGFKGLVAVNLDEYHLSALGSTGNDLSQVRIDALEAEQGHLTYAQFSQVDLRSEYNRQDYHTDYSYVHLTGTYHWNSQSSIEFSLSQQKSDFQNPIHERTYFWSPNQQYSFDYRNNSRVAFNEYGVDVADAANWHTYQTRSNADAVLNQFKSAGLVLHAGLSSQWKFHMGVQLKRFENQQARWEYGIRGASNYPAQLYGQRLPDNFNKGMGGGHYPSTWIVPSKGAFRQLYTGPDFASREADVIRGVEERVDSFFVQFDYLKSLGGYELDGNVGFRWSQLTQISEQVEGPWSTFYGPRQFHQKEEFFLPSPFANAVLRFSSDMLWRVTISRNWDRTEVSELSPVVGISPASRRVRMGNPGLEPVKSISADSSVDWSIAETHFLSLGAFYKSLDNLSDYQWRTYPYKELGLDLSIVENEGQTGETLYSVLSLEDDGQVDIRGMELSGLVYLWPDELKQSLGAQFSYTHTLANRDYLIEGEEVRKPFLGISKNTWNLILFYDDDMLGFRLAAYHRSKYLERVPESNGNDESGVHSSTFVDFSSYYRFNSQLRLDFEVSNLTNEPFNQYTDSSNLPYVYTTTGRTYSLELNYQF